MKMITAIIQENKLDEVRQALIDAEITRITVSRASGHGRGQDQEDRLYRGRRIPMTLIPKIRLDIAVNDEFVDITVKTIMENAKSTDGRIGDGKIFIMPLEECIRIRTGETGGEAI